MIVGVIGSGSIGPDLAYGFLSALAREKGACVYLVDIRQEALDAGVLRIQAYAKKAVSRGKMAKSAADAMLAALKPTRRLGDLANCDYVLEAASEDLNIKRRILADLEAVVRPDCLIGFATSGIPRSQIAAEVQHPNRCFVNHPFYPAWRSLPIEVVPSGNSSYLESMLATLSKLGKVPILTSDVPCFAADDIFCNYISEAARIVEEGLATPAQVDAIVNNAIGGGGPFNVMDLTRGNLLVVHCQELMQYAETGSAWFAPPGILRTRGSALWHDPENPGNAQHSEELAKIVLDRILAVLIGRTYFVIDNKICAPDDLDWMMRMALGFRKGLAELAEEMGGDRVFDLCDRFAKAYPGFPLPPSIASKHLPSSLKMVKVERGEIAILKVFRPEVKNALSKRTLSEIDSAICDLLADPSVKGIIFTSWDGALAGADILELSALESPEACRQICLDAHPIFARIQYASKPIVAALDGPVMGGGAEISMACHARVVGKQLQLAQPEVNLGIIPGYGGTQRLPRLIGIEKANEILRTGRSVQADEACALGWAHGSPVNDPLGAARELIQKHLAGELQFDRMSTEAMLIESLPAVDIGHRSLAIDAILKDVLRRGLACPLDSGLLIEADGFARCKNTVDMDIGMKNFIQNGPRVPAAFLHE